MNHLASRRMRIVTNMPLSSTCGHDLEVDRIQRWGPRESLAILNRLASADAIVLSTPSRYQAVLAAAAIRRSMSCRLVYFDVVVPVAAGGWDRLKRAQYARLIRKADRILTVHADTTEYERLLQLPAERFHYVGFKSNSWEDSASITSGRETADTGTYVLACGRSYRDFATFAEAMAEANLPARILMDQQDVRREGSIVPQTLPSNVEIIRDDGSRRSWLKAMLAARIVVAPLRAGVHQPAGISVYLEAMSLSRPVIVTEGTSTRGMLDDSLAGIVPPEDARALALEVRRLWDNHKLRHERIAAARKYVEGLGGIDRMSCAIVRATFDLLQTHAGALGSAPINPPVLDPS